STGLVHFQDTFAAHSASQTNGANPIRFDGDVTLGAGSSGFYGNVTLDGLTFSSAGPVQMGSGPVTDGDSLTLFGGTVEIGGNGQYTVYAATDGAVALTLSGGSQAGPAGSKSFRNTVGTGTALLSITQVEGSGPVAFTANVATGDLTTLANASFGPMTLTASGAVQIGSNPAAGDTAILAGLSTWTGAATWNIYAPLTGPQNLVLAGSGTKTFHAAVGGSAAATAIGTGTGAAISQTGSGAVFFESTVRTASGMVQTDTAAPVTFRGDIVSAAGDTDSTFNANLTLDGLAWTSGGTLSLGNTAADTLTISGSAVSISTAAANEAITIHARVTGAQNLSLAAGTATARLNAAVGFEAANLPLNLAITAGAIELAGASITTDGSQSYTGPVGLFANTTLSSNGLGAGGTISLSSSLDSDALATARSLTVNTAGPLSFNGAVGATYPLASITSDAPGLVQISGGSVNTTGLQSWNDPVSITADTRFESAAASGTAIHFASTLMPDADNSQALVADGGAAQVHFADENGTPTLRFASIDVATTSTAGDAILVEGSIHAAGDIDWGAALTIAAADNTDTLLSHSGQQRFAAAVVHSNGIVEAGSGGLDFNASYAATAAGSDAPTLTGYDGGIASITIAGDMSLASFTHFADELVFDGAATQAFRSNNQVVANLRTTGKSAGNGLLIADADILQTGAARTTTIESGWLDIATNNLGWVADTNAAAMAVPDSFRGIAGSLVLFEGTELRCGNFLAAAGYTVSHTGSAMSRILADGSVVFDGTLTGNEFATLRMTGAGTSLEASEPLGHLTLASGGTIELASDISLSHNLVIETGVLDVSPANHSIELAGHWTNSPGNTGFASRQGEVRFTRPVTDGPIEVRGSTSWYRFVCEVAGQSIQFEQNRMQTFLVGGAFRVQGASESVRIRLTRLAADQTGDLDWVLPAAPDATRMWQIDLLPGA
ncbi:MAG: hypothetical protein JXJ30_00550, partial [Halothiobacillaceae bacterium]|nr:hypothetical protein [Halothiobacillaceae bacterium]